MKKILFSGIFLLMGLAVLAQGKLYLLFEFMEVHDENASEYLDVEEFWSGIHQQRVADKSILGWDLWALTPAGSKQGSNYLTVTQFSSLQKMLEASGGLDIMGYAQKANPQMSEKDLNAMMDKTVHSRDIANQVFIEEVDQTDDNFKMHLGMVVTLDVMKQLDDGYEKAESEIFKPIHQQFVNSGKSGHWGLMRTILPAGSEAYGTHIAYSFFNDYEQLAKYMEMPMGDWDNKTQIAVQQGLKTRDWKEKIIGHLVKMVR